MTEPADDLEEIHEDGWLILWDGTPDGWLRIRPPCNLEYWR